MSTARAFDSRARVMCVALFVGTLLLFSRACGNGFLDYDDPDFVMTNVHVQSGLTWAGVRWAFTSGGYAANWQPLTWISLMIDRQIYGDRAWGFHATSVIIHALNAVMAFLALRRLTGAFWTSAACAALFAWHPLRVESVAWISERKDVLSIFFGLVSLWAYAGYAEKSRAGNPGARRDYFFALGAFAAGLLCKAMLVTFPCVLVLLDFWPLERIRREALRAVLREKIPFFVLAIASSVVTYAVQDAGGAVNHSLAFGARTANAVVSVARYFGKFFYPFDLAVVYPLPARWSFVAVTGAVLLISTVTIFAWVQRGRRPWILIGWLWFVGTLVPVLGIVQSGSQAMADRYTYLPLLGVAIALLWSVRDAIRSTRSRELAIAAMGLVLVGCVVRTWNQIGVWRDSTTLFDHALAVTRDNFMAHAFRATTLLNEGRVDEAEEHCRRAIAINPDYAPAHHGLGVALEKSGHEADAMFSYRRAIELRPDFAPAHARLGDVLLRHGQAREALAHFEMAARYRKDDAPLFVALGLALAQLDRSAEAEAAYVHALALAPDSAAAHNNYANLLVSLRRMDEALKHYERALQLDASFVEACYNYANALRETGHLENAIELYLKAIALRPIDADLHYALGLAWEQKNRADQAIAAYREAVRLKPAQAEAHYNLGVLLLGGAEFTDARSHFEAAIKSRPAFGAPYLGLGLIAEQEGKIAEAIGLEERAVALDPANGEAHLALGNAFYASHRADDALAQWEQALKLDPRLEGVHEKIAQARGELAKR